MLPISSASLWTSLSSTYSLSRANLPETRGLLVALAEDLLDSEIRLVILELLEADIVESSLNFLVKEKMQERREREFAVLRRAESLCRKRVQKAGCVFQRGCDVHLPLTCLPTINVWQDRRPSLDGHTYFAIYACLVLNINKIDAGIRHLLQVESRFSARFFE
jgi:hypothetical protein